MSSKKEKPLYEAPKISKLDEQKSALGEFCLDGSGNEIGCSTGFSAGQCLEGQDGVLPN